MTHRHWWYLAAFSFICTSGLVGCACYSPFDCGHSVYPAPSQHGTPGPIPGSGTMAPGNAPMQTVPGSGTAGSGGF